MTMLATITPPRYLYLTTKQLVHWANAHYADNPSYVRFFQEQSDLGKFIILDSGKIPIAHVVHYADMMSVKEIVVSYEPFNKTETVARATETFLLCAVQRETYQTLQGLRPSFMLVPQGVTPYDWLRCAHELISLFLKIRTSYPVLVPKELTLGLTQEFVDRLTKDECALVISSLTHFRRAYRTNAHLLNWAGSSSPLENYPFRSVSSTYPFDLAMRSLAVEQRKPVDIMQRTLTLSEQDAVRSYVTLFNKKLKNLHPITA